MESKTVILAPVYEDIVSARMLVDRLARMDLVRFGQADILLVDDGSVNAPIGSVDFAALAFSGTAVHLVRNVGQAAALAVGLCHALESGAQTIVVMDGDGQDRAEDVPLLLSALSQYPESIVAAQRVKRSEPPLFRLFYSAYKLLFYLMTRQRIDFGNFTAMRASAAQRLVHMPELWTHYAGTLLASRLNIVRVPLERGDRYDGQSRMGFQGLVLHGLKSMALFSDRALARLMLFALGTVAAGLFGLIIAIVMKAFGAASPGWVTTIAAAVAGLLAQIIVISFASLILVLANRTDPGRMPIHTARLLIRSVTPIGAGIVVSEPTSVSSAELMARAVAVAPGR